ncbi:MAG: aldo/keto reductase [Chloroflexota bacterium]|mgnify:CR=1 FL=1|nr:aldo/keto reductase [Chloroflexota bacterium]
MRYKLLGKSGLRVSELCLGTMTFGETWGWGASKDESRAMFDRFTDVGGNFIDTSVNYTDGTSEDFLGEFLAGRRDDYVVATKYTLTKPDDTHPNGGGNSRKNMMKSVERSLKRLQTDHIDLYYLHAWDYMTPVDEVLRGLDDLVRQGKVTYIAISDTPDWIVAEANAVAELRGWSSFVGLQIPYSLTGRSVERALLPMARHWGMAVLPWGLLDAGILTGKFLTKPNEPTRVNADQFQMSERTTKIVMEVQQIAQETGHSMAQVAINWVRQQPAAQMLPILGARTVKQLDDNVACLEWTLTPEQWARLDGVSKIDMGFPHDFLPRNPYIFGASFDEIDNHRA